jgi:outer membrane protein OmpA-like peptidoglycan-associated protein
MTKNAPMSRRSVNSALIALGAFAAGCVPKSQVTEQPPHGAAGAAAVDALPQPAAPPAPASPLPAIVDFNQAVADAAHAVFATAPVPDTSTAVVIIDPLVDGVTGYQSKATQTIQDRIAGFVKADFPRYSVQRITPQSLRQQPRVLVGTFTPVSAQMNSTGPREALRFCLVMGDLKSGKIVAKSVTRARIEDANIAPTAAFADSPVWTPDPSLQAYVATCQGSRVGDPIKPEYLDGLLAAALISEAGDAYNEQRYGEALALYTTARKTPAGDQLRVYNGLYLSLTRLGRTEQAAAAFRDLVDFGLRKQQLAVKFLFRPGSVRFATDSRFSDSTYGMWLQQIASRAASSHICLQITGHTSPTGPAAMNDSLSLLRAEYVQSRLEGEVPALKNRTVAAGVGARENLIGTGRDDASDILDRRVELKPIEPCG